MFTDSRNFQMNIFVILYHRSDRELFHYVFISYASINTENWYEIIYRNQHIKVQETLSSLKIAGWFRFILCKFPFLHTKYDFKMVTVQRLHRWVATRRARRPPWQLNCLIGRATCKLPRRAAPRSRNTQCDTALIHSFINCFLNTQLEWKVE